MKKFCLLFLMLLPVKTAQSQDIQVADSDVLVSAILDSLRIRPFNEQKFEIRGLTFSSGSTVPQRNSTQWLDKLIDAFHKLPSSFLIEISGHTDNTGTVAANRNISEQRARSVYSYFVEKGIDADRITYKGYGPDAPVASNATQSGRLKNRRVEIRFTGLDHRQKNVVTFVDETTIQVPFLIMDQNQSSVWVLRDNNSLLEELDREHIANIHLADNSRVVFRPVKQKDPVQEITPPETKPDDRAEPAQPKKEKKQLKLLHKFSVDFGVGVDANFISGNSKKNYLALIDALNEGNSSGGSVYSVRIQPYIFPAAEVRVRYDINEKISGNLGLRYTRLGYKVLLSNNFSHPVYQFDDNYTYKETYFIENMAFPLSLSCKVLPGLSIYAGGALSFNTRKERLIYNTKQEIIINNNVYKSDTHKHILDIDLLNQKRRVNYHLMGGLIYSINKKISASAGFFYDPKYTYKYDWSVTGLRANTTLLYALR